MKLRTILKEISWMVSAKAGKVPSDDNIYHALLIVNHKDNEEITKLIEKNFKRLVKRAITFEFFHSDEKQTIYGLLIPNKLIARRLELENWIKKTKNDIYFPFSRKDKEHFGDINDSNFFTS